MDRVDIINSTFGKALGGATGGYTAANSKIVELLRQKARPYLFSNSLAPCTAACAHEALNILTNDSTLISKLRDNTNHFRSRMSEAGFSMHRLTLADSQCAVANALSLTCVAIAGKDHPISPVMLGDARLASVMADDMLKQGIYVIGFSYPVVPKGLARIRGVHRVY
jgi:glycine C-acetyltransferase